MADDRIEIIITWKGKKRAELGFVLDNSLTVPLSGSLVGTGEIRVGYTRQGNSVHQIMVGLMFPGKELEDLKAVATLNGGSPKSLGTSQSRKHFWIADGVVP